MHVIIVIILCIGTVSAQYVTLCYYRMEVGKSTCFTDDIAIAPECSELLAKLERLQSIYACRAQCGSSNVDIGIVSDKGAKLSISMVIPDGCSPNTRCRYSRGTKEELYIKSSVILAIRQSVDKYDNTSYSSALKSLCSFTPLTGPTAALPTIDPSMLSHLEDLPDYYVDDRAVVLSTGDGSSNQRSIPFVIGMIAGGATLFVALLWTAGYCF